MVAMETFDIEQSRVGTGKIFPARIEEMDWIGYHGTSSAYSARIEAEGFKLEKPIPIEDIDFVIAMAYKVGVDASGAAGFKHLKSISFSPISELALSYSQPKSLGGQGLEFVRAAADRVVSGHGSEVDPEDSARLVRILAEVGAIRTADPVIYAVNLQGLGMAQYQTVTKAVHIYQAIPPERIVAKVRVSSRVDYSLINADRHKEAINIMYWSNRRHYIKELAR